MLHTDELCTVSPDLPAALRDGAGRQKDKAGKPGLCRVSRNGVCRIAGRAERDSRRVLGFFDGKCNGGKAVLICSGGVERLVLEIQALHADQVGQLIRIEQGCCALAECDWPLVTDREHLLIIPDAVHTAVPDYVTVFFGIRLEVKIRLQLTAAAAKIFILAAKGSAANGAHKLILFHDLSFPGAFVHFRVEIDTPMELILTDKFIHYMSLIH